MNDNYNHSDRELIYVVENIPGPLEPSNDYRTLINEFNSQLTNHCTCKELCGNGCACLERSGGLNYTVNIHNILGLNYMLSYESEDIKASPIIECNSLCLCTKVCGNRLVQNGPIRGLVIKECNKSKGFGLFSEKVIPKGVFICEYAGEIITKKEALKRHKLNSEQGNMNYIFCLKEHSDGDVTDTFIDPSVFGNIGRYINHSCDPNCIIIPVRVDMPIPKLAIFSCIDILPNTELTYDYGSYNPEPKLEKNTYRQKCFCNSQKCKGLLPFSII